MSFGPQAHCSCVVTFISLGPDEKLRENRVTHDIDKNTMQNLWYYRAEKKHFQTKLAKQDPGRTKQSRKATAGRNSFLPRYHVIKDFSKARIHSVRCQFYSDFHPCIILTTWIYCGIYFNSWVEHASPDALIYDRGHTGPAIRIRRLHHFFDHFVEM